MTDPDSARTGDGGTTDTACTADDETLCLNRGRFRVEVTWRDFKGQTGKGHVVTVDSWTGYCGRTKADVPSSLEAL